MQDVTKKVKIKLDDSDMLNRTRRFAKLNEIFKLTNNEYSLLNLKTGYWLITSNDKMVSMYNAMYMRIY